VYVIGAAPDHVPFAAESVRPTAVVPLIDGAVVSVGGVAAVTTAVWLDSAVLAPPLSVAVTFERSVLPTSELVRTYVWLVAPEMLAQLLPLPSQRSHRYWNVIVPDPDQLPLVVVRVAPCCAVPETFGSVVFVGPEAMVASPDAATTAATSVAAPVMARARTRRREVITFLSFRSLPRGYVVLRSDPRLPNTDFTNAFS
jgi:hypothetical protein